MAILRAIIDLLCIFQLTLTSVTVTSAVETRLIAARSMNFQGLKNRALNGFVYANLTARSISSCGVACLRHGDCKSVNFYEGAQRCQLSNATRQGRADDLADSLGSVYLEVVEPPPLAVTSEPEIHNRSCKTLLNSGRYNSSGVYTISPAGHHGSGIRVYCDMELDGGGWTVLQRRQDGSVDFYRDWASYRAGFGDLSGEFWLGNDNLVALTSDESRGSWEILFELWDGEDNTRWARYEDFKILGEETEYTLSVGQYNGTAGDSFSSLSGIKFSTKDRDNDNADHACAQERKGGWWFDGCAFCNLNGVYDDYWGINWYHWKGNGCSLKNCTMKMRENERQAEKP